MTFGFDKTATNCYKVASDFDAAHVCVAVVIHFDVEKVPLN